MLQDGEETAHFVFPIGRLITMLLRVIDKDAQAVVVAVEQGLGKSRPKPVILGLLLILNLTE